ncbi:hypothetical protein AVEN_126225-1 [Araneus ventricosus]|uniref:Uncharacterized protein n=1 Tax=Araneus ventricosus TaxID=182803 RepID=A0A4Y2DSZ7_ARAVE|nr:hypothetical protein AVEN_126225-1 [Araneus ventricosus]
MDLSHKANKLIDAMKFKYHLPPAQHHVKEMKYSSCITIIETSEQGMQTLPTKQQAKPTSEDLVELKTASYATTLKKTSKFPNSDQFNQPFSFIIRNSITKIINSCQRKELNTSFEKIYHAMKSLSATSRQFAITA